LTVFNLHQSETAEGIWKWGRANHGERGARA